MLLREVEYARPSSVEEAVRMLGAHDGARALAGGQTLVNVMKARAAAPDVLVERPRDELPHPRVHQFLAAALCSRYSRMNPSRSPSSTRWASPASWPVRWSLTRVVGCRV